MRFKGCSIASFFQPRDRQKVLSRLRWGILLLTLGQTNFSSASAADRIFLNYSIFGRSVSIQTLETFTHTGKLSGDLVSYSRFIKPKQLVQLREGLQQKVDFSPVAISQFLYTPTGETLLQRVSQVIQTPEGRGSFYALRSALILAATDPEGLTPLSILRHYPNPEIVVNVEAVIQISNEVGQLFKQTAAATQQIRSLTPTTLLSLPNALQLEGLKQPGPFGWEKVTLKLQDSSAKRLRYIRKVRNFWTDFYLPRSTQPRPVVIISHGVNSDRQSYAYVAEHLASYGFGVVVPEHPGSNKQQLQALLAGQGREVAEPTEFLDRPLDIQFVLDTLQHLDQTDERFQGKLNLQKVGIMGQSFGGYTSLAAAGAPLHFAGLRQSCSQSLGKTLNLSLVLQCQALRLPVVQYNLADPRIKAAIAINPLTSGVLGAASLAQIKVPVMIIAGSADIIAPALLEQIQPFGALTTPQRYLVLMQNGNHFSTIAPTKPGTDSLPTLKGLEGPSPELARTYLKVLSLVFMQTYLEDQPTQGIYLTSESVASLSRSPLPLSLINTLPIQERGVKDTPK